MRDGAFLIVRAVWKRTVLPLVYVRVLLCRSEGGRRDVPRSSRSGRDVRDSPHLEFG